LSSLINSREDAMKRWIEIFGNIFISVTLAEVGEYHTSLEIFDMNVKASQALWIRHAWVAF
jgi:hypothetical protein